MWFSAFTKSCKILQKFAKFYKSLQKFTKVYKCLQKFAKVYKKLQKFTKVCKSLRKLTKVYKSLQKFAKVYKSLWKLTNVFHCFFSLTLFMWATTNKVFHFSFLKTGPFYGLVCLFIPVTMILLKVLTTKTWNISSWCLSILRAIVTIGVSIGFSRIVSQEDGIDTFLFFGLMLSIVQILTLHFYIKLTPNLHVFASKISNYCFDYKFVELLLGLLKDLEEIFISPIKFVLCLDLNYPPNPMPVSNRILPVWKFTKICKSLQKFAKVYKSVWKFAKGYKNLQNFAKVYKSLPWFKNVY